MQTTEEPETKLIRKATSMPTDAEELMERLGMGAMRLDGGFLVARASGKAALLLRRPRQELEGRPLDAAVPEDSARRIIRACADARKLDAPVTVEAHLRRPTERWLSCRCLADAEGFFLVLEDTTARKNADREALLGERKARLRWEGIYDSLPIGMCVLDPDMRYLAVNDSLARMNGVSPADHRGRTVREVVPRLADKIEATAREVIESGRPRYGLEIEGSPETPRGPARTWITHWTPIVDESGNRVGVNAVIQNITELKEALKALRGSEERYRTLHDTLGQGVIELDGENKIVSANPAAEGIIGLSLREMYGRELLDAMSLIPGVSCEGDPSCARAIRELQELKAGKPFRNQVVRFTNPRTGQERWVSADSAPRFDPARKEAGGAFAIISDITDLKRAQEVLRDAGRKLQKEMRREAIQLASAVENAGEGIVLFNSSLVIEYVNAAFENMSEYQRSDLVGRSVDRLNEYFMGDRYQDILKDIVREGKAWSGRRRRKKKSGETIEVSLNVSPIRDENGNIINYVAVTHDVTREVMLQHQLAEIQKTEAIGNLAGGIAHDLKNIFTPIVLNTETALMDLGEDDPVRPMLEETLQAARLGNDLVSQIVTFSRRQTREKHPVDVSSILYEALAFLRSALPSTIDIQHRFATGEARIMADPVQIKQVLINLGDNAGHAMRERGGVLDVSAGTKVLSESEAGRISPDLSPGAYVRILVRDTGEGMDEDTAGRVFEPFFSTKKKSEGTGMGLAIVHGIVRDHQGAITFWSKPGKGTTFSILLPALTQRGGG